MLVKRTKGFCKYFGETLNVQKNQICLTKDNEYRNIWINIKIVLIFFLSILLRGTTSAYYIENVVFYIKNIHHPHFKSQSYVMNFCFYKVVMNGLYNLF